MEVRRQDGSNSPSNKCKSRSSVWPRLQPGLTWNQVQVQLQVQGSSGSSLASPSEAECHQRNCRQRCRNVSDILRERRKERRLQAFWTTVCPAGGAVLVGKQRNADVSHPQKFQVRKKPSGRMKYVIFHWYKGFAHLFSREMFLLFPWQQRKGRPATCQSNGKRRGQRRFLLISTNRAAVLHLNQVHRCLLWPLPRLLPLCTPSRAPWDTQTSSTTVSADRTAGLNSQVTQNLLTLLFCGGSQIKYSTTWNH